MTVKGTEETKTFYDAAGWRRSAAGDTLDRELFGVKEDGPRRVAMFERKWARIFDYIGTDGQDEVLEVGCGGSPETRLLDLFGKYVGVDFSATGIQVAKDRTAGYAQDITLMEADAVDLPFDDARFDTVYSAHMIYHIDDPAAQTAAMREMQRVLRPGGTLVLVTANPRPLLFPARLAMRVVADTPVLCDLARRLKGKSPVPYRPAKLGWYLRELRDCTGTRVFNGGIASTHFNQTVSEFRGAGKLIWSLFDKLDERVPGKSAYLGNYAVIATRK